jgi:hypothetical protein
MNQVACGDYHTARALKHWAGLKPGLFPIFISWGGAFRASRNTKAA